MTRSQVTNIRFRHGTVSMKVGGRRITDRVKTTKFVPYVGHYKRRRAEVLIDRKIRSPKERRCIAVHEAIERDLRYHQGMPKTKAHRIAEREEAKYARSHGVNVSRYGRHVEQVWRKNRRRGRRRRR
jgi:hypothetical protein